MSDPMTIEYASEVLEQPADRLLRRIVGWMAIAYAALSLIATALRVALIKGWVAGPQNTTWMFEGSWQVGLTAAEAALNAVYLYGGVRLLNRWRWSIIILRASAFSSVALAVVSAVLFSQFNTFYASYWSTPGSAAMHAAEFLSGLWLPAIIVLLTLPPLARRMV